MPWLVRQPSKSGLFSIDGAVQAAHHAPPKDLPGLSSQAANDDVTRARISSMARAGMGTRPDRCREYLISMRVREVLADVADVDLPGLTGVIVIVNPGGDQALSGYLEMCIHENGAVRM